MNERQWWAQKVQPRLHLPQEGKLAWKIQDAFVTGRPDVMFNVKDPKLNFGRIIGWLELKYDMAWPKRPDTTIDVGVTAEQMNHLKTWYRLGRDQRTAVVLYGVGEDWWMFKHTAVVLVPNSKWTRADIIESSWFSGQGYNSLSTIWNTLTALPRFDDVD